MGEDLTRIHPERPCQVQKFNHIDPSFSDLDSGNDRLRGFHTRCKLVLRKSRKLSSLDERRAKCTVAATSECLQCDALRFLKSKHI